MGAWNTCFLGPVAPAQQNRQKNAARSELSIRMLVNAARGFNLLQI